MHEHREQPIVDRLALALAHVRSQVQRFRVRDLFGDLAAEDPIVVEALQLKRGHVWRSIYSETLLGRHFLATVRTLVGVLVTQDLRLVVAFERFFEG